MTYEYETIIYCPLFKYFKYVNSWLNGPNCWFMLLKTGELFSVKSMNLGQLKYIVENK